MTRRTVISLALSFIVISALHSTSNAQTFSYLADTGVIDLAPGQTLRVSVAGSGASAISLHFRKIEYFNTGYTDGVERRQVGSQSTTGPVTLSGDQCLVFNLGGTGAGVRVQLYTSSQNLKANAFVISPAAGGSTSGSDLPMEQISLNFTNISVYR